MAVDKKQKKRILHRLRCSKVMARRGGYTPCLTPLEDIAFLGWSGLCDICGIPEEEVGKPLHLDHCHITGKFRGWLCLRCNMGLGMFKESIRHLENALHYLTTREIK